MVEIYEGAEAIASCDIIYNTEVLIKTRFCKKYRVTSLDEELREFRTKREAKILGILEKASIYVPRLIAVGKYTIIMERIHGVLLRDTKQKTNVMKKIGIIAKKMHACGVVHGDFTPANIIISKNKIYIIDFGLGLITNSIEEKALDLLLFKRSVDKKDFEIFIKAYAKDNFEYKKVIGKLNDIEKRGRYQIRTLE